MENYGETAVALFETGMNCAQSVFCAFAEDLGMDAETAAKVSSGLGGGVGRLREVCGAVTGATLVLGMKYGPDKTVVYEKVQAFAAEFKAEMGSIVCRELLSGSGATSGGAQRRELQSTIGNALVQKSSDSPRTLLQSI